MDNNIHVRLDALMEYYRLNQKEFADICGITQQAIALMRKNKTIPSGSVFIQLSMKLTDINTRWLLTGEGEMLVRKRKEYEIEEKREASEARESEMSYNKGSQPQILENLMAVYKRIIELEFENKRLIELEVENKRLREELYKRPI